MRLRKTIAKLPNDPLWTAIARRRPGSLATRSILATLRKSLRGRLKLRLKYQSSNADKPSTRDVCPYALVAANGMFYVLAYCGKKTGLRVFRMDRVHGAESGAMGAVHAVHAEDAEPRRLPAIRQHVEHPVRRHERVGAHVPRRRLLGTARLVLEPQFDPSAQRLAATSRDAPGRRRSRRSPHGRRR